MSPEELERAGKRTDQLFRRLDGTGQTDNEIVSNVRLLKENLGKLGLDFSGVVD